MKTAKYFGHTNCQIVVSNTLDLCIHFFYKTILTAILTIVSLLSLPGWQDLISQATHYLEQYNINIRKKYWYFSMCNIFYTYEFLYNVLKSRI